MGAQSESSAWHAPARDAERPSAGKGGRKGASASKDRRSERFGFTGATKELPTEAAVAFQLMCFLCYMCPHLTQITHLPHCYYFIYVYIFMKISLCVHFYEN